MKAIGYDPLVLALALVVSIAPEGLSALARVALGLLISLAFGVTREQPSPIRLEARARASRRRA
jgi:hypothetical protein